jgi:hypothetical protein
MDSGRDCIPGEMISAGRGTEPSNSNMYQPPVQRNRRNQSAGSMRSNIQDCILSERRRQDNAPPQGALGELL